MKNCISIYVSVTLVVVGCSRQQDRQSPAPEPPSKKIAQTATVVIPVTESADLPKNQAASITVSVIPSEGEEPAQGPNSFDVRDDGSIAISDPLRLGIVNFSVVQGTDGPKAVFKSFAALKTPVQLLETQNEKQYLVKNLLTGKFAQVTTRLASPRIESPIAASERGLKPGPADQVPVHPGSSSTGTPSTANVDTKITSNTEGSLSYLLDGRPSKIQVRLSLPDWRLASLALLGADEQGQPICHLRGDTHHI